MWDIWQIRGKKRVSQLRILYCSWTGNYSRSHVLLQWEKNLWGYVHLSYSDLRFMFFLIFLTIQIFEIRSASRKSFTSESVITSINVSNRSLFTYSFHTFSPPLPPIFPFSFLLFPPFPLFTPSMGVSIRADIYRTSQCTLVLVSLCTGAEENLS